MTRRAAAPEAPDRAAEGREPEAPPVTVGIRQLPHSAGLPERASAGSAGYDLRAAVDAAVQIEPGARALIPTGLILGLPPGHEAQVRPRSGLAYRRGLTVLNAPGTIDSDYRGEVKLLLVNLGQRPITIDRGERLAQMVVAAVPEISFRDDDTLGARPVAGRRNDGGFGSSGC